MPPRSPPSGCLQALIAHSLSFYTIFPQSVKNVVSFIRLRQIDVGGAIIYMYEQIL